jgi:2-polyprenyl-3-methyl-5-hydroxy-6-metoxy-1,4-benzoquinol methylase
LLLVLQGRGVQAAAAAGQQEPQHPDLSQVGLVLWQSGFVLADFLLLRLAGAGGAVGSSSGGVADSSRGSWAGVRVLELGCGGGTVGLLLALAGAQVGLCGRLQCMRCR